VSDADDRSAELVFADALIERGDPRGELIVIEAQLAALGPGDVRAGDLTRRAGEILPEARAAWARELGVRPEAVLLDRGIARAVEIVASVAGVRVPDNRWLRELHVSDAPYSPARSAWNASRRRDAEAGLFDVVQQAAFRRVRTLVVSQVRFTPAGFARLCALDEMRDLTALDIGQPASLVTLLSSRSFARLESLAVSVPWLLQENPAALRAVDGLPSLRRLRFDASAWSDVPSHVLRAPLAYRLEELEGTQLPPVQLPNLRRLRYPANQPAQIRALVAHAARVPALESLDLSGTHTVDGGVLLLADPGVLPSLQRLDVSRTSLRPLTLAKLHARFGDGLVTSGMK
jgi:uncharacterized protein (TIGR02996 family)